MESNDHFLDGKFLIAMPGMQDPRFERSVVLICSHTPEQAMGLIINKPVEGLAFGELMRRYDLHSDASLPDVPVMFGGPVELSRGFFLHSPDYNGGENTRIVTEDLSLTADVDILRAISEGRGPKRCLLALGYAGWGEGQIETEMLDNGWIHCDADATLVFDAEAETIWTKAIAKMGVDLSGLTGASGRA
ncbi:MAG: YqgE/AlgH family protein [Rhizomicrobium sp.]